MNLSVITLIFSHFKQARATPRPAHASPRGFRGGFDVVSASRLEDDISDIPAKVRLRPRPPDVPPGLKLLLSKVHIITGCV